MKRIIFTISFILISYAYAFSQQASQLIPTQGLNPKPFTPPNFLYVNQADNRIWPVLADSLKLKYINIKWLNDSVVVISDRRYVKLNGNYTDPNFVSSLSANKVTGLAQVAVSSDYNDLSNKPVLNNFLLSATAASIYQVKGNYLTSYTETDPIWNSVSANYRTKTQNDILYQPFGNYLSSFTELDPTVSAYAKSLTSFSSIKSSTDPLYKSSTYAPSNAEIISALGFTPYNSSNPNGFISVVTSAQIIAALGFTPYSSANPNNFLTSVPVTSVFGRTGTVVPASGDYNTSQITENLNLFFTPARVLSTTLSGLNTGTNTPIVASNTLITALQNLQSQVSAINNNMAINNATVGLSKSTLNSTYPNTNFGFMVFCPSILLGGAIYVRVTTGATGTWQTISAPPTL